jgi:hypothetical protein
MMFYVLQNIDEDSEAPMYQKALDEKLLEDWDLDVDTPQGTKTDCAFAIQHRRPQLS